MKKTKQIFPPVLRHQVILVVVSQMESSVLKALACTNGLIWHKSMMIWLNDIKSKSTRGRTFSHCGTNKGNHFQQSILIWGKHTNDKNFNRIKILKHKPENQTNKNNINMLLVYGGNSCWTIFY